MDVSSLFTSLLKWLLMTNLKLWDKFAGLATFLFTDNTCPHIEIKSAKIIKVFLTFNIFEQNILKICCRTYLHPF